MSTNKYANNAVSLETSLSDIEASLEAMQAALGIKEEHDSPYLKQSVSYNTRMRRIAYDLCVINKALITQGKGFDPEELIKIIAGKVDIEQGVEHAGKFMGVDATGQVKPLNVPGVSPEGVETIETMTKLLQANRNPNEFAIKVPSSTWKVTHNLNMYPSVTCVESTGNILIGEVKYLNNNSLEVSFKTSDGRPVYATGKIYLA